MTRMMPLPQAVAPLAAAALALAPLLPAPPASAQMLLDATGAAAIQGGINSTAMPQYGDTLRQVRASLGRAPGQTGPASGDLGPIPPPAGAGEPAAQAPAAPPAAGPVPPRTYVNGYYVALCSHGGLCLGQLRRALRHP